MSGTQALKERLDKDAKRIAELEAHLESLQNRYAQRTAELESVLLAFDEWARPLVNRDDGYGLPEIVTQAKTASFKAKIKRLRQRMDDKY